MTAEAASAPVPPPSMLADCAADARRFEVFALLRLAEARAAGRPRIGRSRVPDQNVVDLAQAPHLAFPGSTLASIGALRGRPLLRGYYLGLTGPMAPLPLHITEVAYDEERHASAQPFGGMLDLVAGRMLQFFYRAWADSQPAVHADRPGDDRFADYIAAVSGAGEGAGPAFPMAARLGLAGLFVGRRSVGAIEDGMRQLLGGSVRVHPFEPRWRVIDGADRTRLGDAGGFATLGRDAVAGGRVRQVADAFRVTIRVDSFQDYRALLPGGPRFAMAAAALDALAPTHLEWVMEIAIAAPAAPPAGLGGGTALGWSSWLGRAPDAPEGYRADARLRRDARAVKVSKGERPHG